jgi:arsenite methyltransferase
VAASPFEAASFRKAYTVHTVYFWTSLRTGFVELHRVLSPGGRLVVGFLPKEWMDGMQFPPDLFKMRTPEEVVGAATEAGFKETRIERPGPATRWNVIVANR